MGGALLVRALQGLDTTLLFRLGTEKTFVGQLGCEAYKGVALRDSFAMAGIEETLARCVLFPRARPFLPLLIFGFFLLCRSWAHTPARLL